MKVTTERKPLLDLLAKLQPITKGRHTLPACGMFLLETGEATLQVSASDLSNSLQGKVKADIAEGGATLAEQSLVALLKNLEGEAVTLTTEGKTLHIQSDSTTISTPATDPQDFPPIPKVEGDPIEVDDLASALVEVEYAACHEDTRPVLECISFKPVDGGIELCTADGFRLSRTKLAASAPLPRQVLVHRTTSALARKLLKGKVGITVGKNAISFGDGTLLLTHLIPPGTYPNYEVLIPQGDLITMTVDTARLQKAVKAAQPIARQGSNIVRLLALAGKDTLEVSASYEDTSIKQEIPCQGGIKIALNTSYLLDILSHCGEQTTIQTSSTSSPAKVETEKSTHVLMPMFVQW